MFFKKMWKKRSKVCLFILNEIITFNNVGYILLNFLSAFLLVYLDIFIVTKWNHIIHVNFFTFYHANNIYLQNHLFPKPEIIVLFFWLYKCDSQRKYCFYNYCWIRNASYRTKCTISSHFVKKICVCKFLKK